MAKLIDNRFVYMMLRTKNNEARIIVCQKLMNARKLEKRLHRQFKDSRFEMSPRIKYRKWWQNHVKIGIAKNPKRRREQVSKDIFRSGRTEWFALTDFELLFVKGLIYWHSWRLFINLIIIIIILSFATCVNVKYYGFNF